jgi:hypothetical protein
LNSRLFTTLEGLSKPASPDSSCYTANRVFLSAHDAVKYLNSKGIDGELALIGPLMLIYLERYNQYLDAE